MTREPLDVGRLRLLREVGLRGSIAAAARALGLTASAVSQQLAALERETGADLVERSPRGVTLTPAGAGLADRAGQVLDLLALARADLDRLDTDVAGPVALAAVAGAAAGFVCDAVVGLGRSHPAVTVGVGVCEPARALQGLLVGDLDLAVVDAYDHAPLALPAGVVARPLLTEPLVLVVPDGWDGPRRATLADLADRDWVMPPGEAACGLAVRSACRAAGFEPRVRWSSEDMLVLGTAVAAGHGVAVLPRLSVPATVAGLATRELAGPPLERRLSLIARGVVLARPAVTAVAEALAAAARPRCA